MRTEFVAVATACVLALVTAPPVRAADAPSSALAIAVACAPTPDPVLPTHDGLHVGGSQDATPRALYGGASDLLVIDGGTAHGVQLNQRFFVRRFVTFGSMYEPTDALPLQTLGWIRVVAVNDTMALATVEHACASIAQGDLLQPFVEPVVPPDIERTDTSGELDFASRGRVLFGDEEKATAGAGDFMVIDRGTRQGSAPGARVAIYRDVQGTNVMASMPNYGTAVPTTMRLPLSPVGEAVVVSAGPMMSLVRITAARDAVRSGDVVVPRK